MGAGAQELRPASAAFPRSWQKAGWEVHQPGLGCQTVQEAKKEWESMWRTKLRNFRQGTFIKSVRARVCVKIQSSGAFGIVFEYS